MATVDDFEPGHQDRVTVLHINFDGTRILTASADHRVKVWERNAQTGQRTLTETWTAHDADIRDVLTDYPPHEQLWGKTNTLCRRNGCIQLRARI
jgi:WD40 repeat protein